jgi:hypothetical protein
MTDAVFLCLILGVFVFVISAVGMFAYAHGVCERVVSIALAAERRRIGDKLTKKAANCGVVATVDEDGDVYVDRARDLPKAGK